MPRHRLQHQRLLPLPSRCPWKLRHPSAGNGDPMWLCKRRLQMRRAHRQPRHPSKHRRRGRSGSLNQRTKSKPGLPLEATGTRQTGSRPCYARHRKTAARSQRGPHPVTLLSLRISIRIQGRSPSATARRTLNTSTGSEQSVCGLPILVQRRLRSHRCRGETT